jgi:hypothetical protein
MPRSLRSGAHRRQAPFLGSAVSPTSSSKALAAFHQNFHKLLRRKRLNGRVSEIIGIPRDNIIRLFTAGRSGQNRILKIREIRSNRRFYIDSGCIRKI